LAEDSFIDVDLGEPVGEQVELFRRFIEGRKFTKQELTDFLGDCERELDLAVQRLKTDEFPIMDYDLTLYRADNGEIIGVMLVGGACFVGEAEKRFSLSMLQEKRNRGYRGVFKIAIESHDYSAPVSADMRLIGFRDKITKSVKARSPYS